MLEKVHWIL